MISTIDFVNHHLTDLVLLCSEGVGDVFQEYESKDNVLVFSSIHLRTQFVGRFPEGNFDVFGHSKESILRLF